MAKLITKQAAIEKDQIVSILNWETNMTINLKSGNGTCLNDNSHYDSIVQWWRSSCEEDLVLDELPKCCYCNKCWNN